MILGIILMPILLRSYLNTFIYLTVTLYNYSFGYIVVFITATFNDKRIDLNRGIVFNVEGFSGHQLFSIITVLILPLLLFSCLNSALNKYQSLAVINLFSIICLTNQRTLLRLLSKLYRFRKYHNLESYKNDPN